MSTTGPLFTVTINQGSDEVMATLNEVKAAVEELQASAQSVEDGLDGLVVLITDLRAQVAAGGGVTEAQLDEVMAGIEAVREPLTDSLEKQASVSTPPTPPVDPVDPVDPFSPA